MINNLSQLKKALVPGATFLIINHCRPEDIGQLRKVTKVDSTCFYSVVDGEPEHKVSRANNGLGSWCEWKTAKHWEFANDICTLHFAPGSPGIVLSIKLK